MAKAQEKAYSKGLTDISGKDGFYRNKINGSRWSYGSELFRTNFTKMIGLNLLMLIFVGPIFFFLLQRFAQIFTLAHSAPFTANLGVGYLPFTSLIAQEELILLSANKNFFQILPLLCLWLSVGLSGGLYIMRNLAWGEEVTIFRDFFLGIKRNFLPVMLATLLFSLIFSSAGFGVYQLKYMMALNGTTWYQVMFQVFLIIAMVFIALWLLMALSMAVTYKSSFFNLIKNSVLVTTVLLPLNLFFAALALLPFLLFFLDTTFFAMAVILSAILGISYCMLTWTVYSQWVFDKFINNNVKNAYKPTEKELAAKRAKDEAKQTVQDDGYVTVGESTFEGVPSDIKPITDDTEKVYELGEMFTRSDLTKLKDSKSELKADAEEYASNPQAYIGNHEENKTEQTE